MVFLFFFDLKIIDFYFDLILIVKTEKTFLHLGEIKINKFHLFID